MKKTLCWILTLAFLLGCCPVLAMAAPEETEGGYLYKVTNGEATITGYDETLAGDITIPQTLGGYPVTAIGSDAFFWCDAITSVTVHEGILSIDGGAFASCAGLTGIFVSENNPNYSGDDRGVLFNKDKTTLIQAPTAISGSYTIPDGVQIIGDSAFGWCEALSAVKIPNGVLTIEDSAFWFCSALLELAIPDSVTTVGYNAIGGNFGLQKVTIGSGVTSFECGFAYCSSLEKIEVSQENTVYSSDDRGVLFDKAKTKLIYAPKGLSGSYTVPDSVKVIEDYAFFECYGLTSVTVGSGLEDFGTGTFDSCIQLSGIFVSEGNPYYSSDDHGVLFNKDKTTLIQAPGKLSGSYTVPDSVITIGESAFYESSLTNVVLGSNVQTVGEGAFYYCYSLAEMTFPDSVTTIGADVFFSCNSLHSVYLGAGVTSLSKDAFTFCDSLSKIQVSEQNTVYSSDDRGVLFNKDKTVLVKAPTAISGSYAIPEGVVTIGGSAFEFCNNLTALTLPDSVTAIEDGAISYCESLAFTQYGNGSYLGNEKNPYHALIQAAAEDISTCTIHQDAKVIAGGAFSWCGDLTQITIPESVVSIGEHAFQSCSGLTGIFVSENNANYSSDDHGVLFNKDKTTLLQAPGAISGSYTVAEGVITVGEGAFLNCSELTAVTIPESTTTISKLAFSSCEGLEEITLGSGVTTVGVSAFAWCEELTDVYYGGSEKQWAAIEIGEDNKYLTEANVHFGKEDVPIGDLDGVAGVSEDDAIYLLQHVLMSEQFPVNQDVDYDGNGSVDEDDAIYLLQHVLMPDYFPLGSTEEMAV